jgi:hypothetical protein
MAASPSADAMRLPVPAPTAAEPRAPPARIDRQQGPPRNVLLVGRRTHKIAAINSSLAEALGVKYAPVAVILTAMEAALPDSFFATEAWLGLRKRQ